MLLGIARRRLWHGAVAGLGQGGNRPVGVDDPSLAQWFGWVTVCGTAAIVICIPMVVMIVLARQPIDVEKQASFKQHIACLHEKDGWFFRLIHAITFSRFIG